MKTADLSIYRDLYIVIQICVETYIETCIMCFWTQI